MMGAVEIMGVALIAWAVGVFVGHAAGYGRGKRVGAAQTRQQMIEWSRQRSIARREGRL